MLCFLPPAPERPEAPERAADSPPRMRLPGALRPQVIAIRLGLGVLTNHITKNGSLTLMNCSLSAKEEGLIAFLFPPGAAPQHYTKSGGPHSGSRNLHYPGKAT
eukprot:9113504-Pyramimonas_sp.AAC.1